jgi:hypothetical protein
MKNKLMIGLASTGLVAVTAMGAWSLANNAIISRANATGTSYSAAFTGTAHPLSKITGASATKVYSVGTWASGNDFRYCAIYGGGEPSTNAAVGSNSGIWAVLTNNSGSAAALTVFFFMNHITAFKLDHYWTGSEATSVTVYTSNTGYSGDSTVYGPTAWTQRDTYSSLTWASEIAITGASTGNYQGVEIEIGVATGSVFGINPTIYWAC